MDLGTLYQFFFGSRKTLAQRAIAGKVTAETLESMAKEAGYSDEQIDSGLTDYDMTLILQKSAAGDARDRQLMVESLHRGDAERLGYVEDAPDRVTFTGTDSGAVQTKAIQEQQETFATLPEADQRRILAEQDTIEQMRLARLSAAPDGSGGTPSAYDAYQAKQTATSDTQKAADPTAPVLTPPDPTPSQPGPEAMLVHAGNGVTYVTDANGRVIRSYPTPGYVEGPTEAAPTVLTPAQMNSYYPVDATGVRTTTVNGVVHHVDENGRWID